MIRFLYSTDWHVKGKSPATRTDDYPSTIRTKIIHFFRLGHELGVDAFLAGGDFFDSPYTSAELVTATGKMIEHELRGKKLFGVWGNHDIIGWNPKTVKRTSIGVFQEFSPFFTILDRTPTFFEANGTRVKMTGISSYAQLDRHVFEDDGETISLHRSRDYIIPENKDGVPHLHIVHGYLSPDPILEDIPHTVLNEIRETKAVVTLTGHEHIGFPVTKLTNGLVYNPGALGRVSASHAEMNRMPKFALVTIHKDGTPEIEPIQVSVAKSGHEVMDRSILDAKKLKEVMLKEAKGNIRDFLKGLDIESVDFYQLLEKYEKEGTVPPKVIREVKRRLGL